MHALAWHFPHLNIIGVDLNFTDLTAALNKGEDFFNSVQKPSKALHYSCADGTQLPLANDSIDIIICSEVLEHIPNYNEMLAEINRVLKPGGTLAVSVPRAWPERICWWLSQAYHQVEGGHVRIFSAHKLAQEIKQQGFVQQKRYFVHALHSPYWWLRCLFWRWGENTWPCRWYHKILIWDLMKKPWLTRSLEALLNPVMGKSVAWHFVKPTLPSQSQYPPNQPPPLNQ